MKKGIAISFVVLGLISVVFGAVTLAYIGDITWGTTSTENAIYKEYGGDAYTGIQQAAADTANNVGVVAKNVRYVESAVVDVTDVTAMGLGAILFVFGGYLILNGLNNMPKKKVSPLAETQIESNSEDIQA